MDVLDIEDIDVGALPDDGTGDAERDAFTKTNAIAEGLRQHRADIANPHGTTAEQVGTYTKATIETKLNDLKVEVQTGTVSPAQLAEVLKGVVVASAAGSITLVEGAARTLTLTETTRSAFEPGTFAALTRKASIADYAVIRPTAYDPATGLLAFTIEKAVGGAGPFTDWEVASLAGPTVAQLALLAQGYAAQAASESARDLARDWATKTTAEVAPGLGFGSKKYAQDSATSAAAAKASADLAAQFDPTTYQRTIFNIARFSAADGNLAGGQAVFTIATGYTVGSAQVFLNGIRLSGPEFVATNGTSVTLGSGVDAGDVLEVVTFLVNGILNVAPLHHTHEIGDLPATLALKSEVAAVSTALAAKLDASAKATTAQAQDGTDDAAYMTPAGVAAAIAKLSPPGPTLDDVRTLAIQLAKLKGSTVGMAAGVADDFKDASGYDAANSANAVYDQTNNIISNPVGGVEELAPMTSNTTPSGQTASATTEYSTSFRAFQAYDGASNTEWISTTQGTQSIQRTTSAARREASYAITPRNGYPTQGPGNFTRWGSNDGGATRTTLDFQNGITWTNGQRRVFTIPSGNRGNYTTYGLTITAGAGANDVYAMSALESLPESAGALELRSVAFAAAAVPAKGSMFALVKATSGAITPNTNLLVDISRDGGTTWTTGTLVTAGSYGGYTMYEANGFDISGQPSGTSMKWRLRTVGSTLFVAVDAVVAQWG